MICVAAGDINGLIEDLSSDGYYHKRKYEDDIPISFVASVNARIDSLYQLHLSENVNEGYKSKMKCKWRKGYLNMKPNNYFWLPEDIAFERRGVKWSNSPPKYIESGLDIRNYSLKFGVEFHQDIPAWYRSSLSTRSNLRSACKDTWNFLQLVDQDCGDVSLSEEYKTNLSKLEERLQFSCNARSSICNSLQQRLDVRSPITLETIMDLNDTIENGYAHPKMPVEEEISRLNIRDCLSFVAELESYSELLQGVASYRKESELVLKECLSMKQITERIQNDYAEWTMISSRYDTASEGSKNATDSLTELSHEDIERVNSHFRLSKSKWEIYKNARLQRIQIMKSLQDALEMEYAMMTEFSDSLNQGFERWEKCVIKASRAATQLTKIFHPHVIDFSIVSKKHEEMGDRFAQNQLYERFLLEIDVWAQQLEVLEENLAKTLVNIKKSSSEVTLTFNTKMRSRIQRNLRKAHISLRKFVRMFFSNFVSSPNATHLLKEAMIKRMSAEKFKEIFLKNDQWIDESMEEKDNFTQEEIESSPQDFTCPLTKELMRDPVTYLGDGKTYEREALLQLLSKKPNFTLDATQIVPNTELSAKIYTYTLGTLLARGASEWAELEASRSRK